MLLWDLLQPSLSQLDNSIMNNGNMPRLPTTGDDTMAYKINRTVTIDGQRKWIHADNEQQYFEKVVQLVGGKTAEPQTKKHPFPEYAQKWFNVYGKPAVATVTALTYQRQIDKYLIPAFSEKNVEDVTTADIQALFNSMGGLRQRNQKQGKDSIGHDYVLCS